MSLVVDLSNVKSIKKMNTNQNDCQFFIEQQARAPTVNENYDDQSTLMKRPKRKKQKITIIK